MNLYLFLKININCALEFLIQKYYGIEAMKDRKIILKAIANLP